MGPMMSAWSKLPTLELELVDRRGCKLLWLVTLPLHSFDFWQTCFWSMGDGHTSELLRWAWPHPVFLLLAHFPLIFLYSTKGNGWQVVAYFFYKNLAFTLTQFWFTLYTGFSGQRFYDDWFQSLYNVLFTALPVIVVGIFDKVCDANTSTPKS